MERAACGVCGATEADILFRGRDVLHTVPEETYPVGRCRRCSHTYLVERPSPSEIGRYYPEDYGPHRHRKKEQEENVPSRHRLIRLRPPFNILDVGCGSGYDLRGFLAQGCGVYGVEPNPKAAEQARREGVQIQCSSVESATFPDGLFHIITMNHALEHLYEPRAAMINLRRMIRPDGLLYLLFPTADGAMFHLFREDWYHLEVPRHLQFFTHDVFARLCRETGFRIVYRATRSGAKGFHRSLGLAAERRPLARWVNGGLRLGLCRAVSRVVLRYVVDGLRLGDVAEYLLRPGGSR